jgi:hypothetical protein
MAKNRAGVGELDETRNLHPEFPRDDAERQKYRTKAGKVFCSAIFLASSDSIIAQ